MPKEKTANPLASGAPRVPIPSIIEHGSASMNLSPALRGPRGRHSISRVDIRDHSTSIPDDSGGDERQTLAQKKKFIEKRVRSVILICICVEEFHRYFQDMSSRSLFKSRE
jgi:hypothetical protein